MARIDFRDHVHDLRADQIEAAYREALRRVRGRYRINPWAQRAEYYAELLRRGPNTEGLSHLTYADGRERVEREVSA